LAGKPYNTRIIKSDRLLVLIQALAWQKLNQIFTAEGLPSPGDAV